MEGISLVRRFLWSLAVNVCPHPRHETLESAPLKFVVWTSFGTKMSKLESTLNSCSNLLCDLGCSVCRSVSLMSSSQSIIETAMMVGQEEAQKKERLLRLFPFFFTKTLLIFLPLIKISVRQKRDEKDECLQMAFHTWQRICCLCLWLCSEQNKLLLLKIQ